MAFSLCTLTNQNVGGILCDTSRGVLRNLIRTEDEYEAADVADSDTFLAALAVGSLLSKNNPAKVFPFPVVEDLSDKSEANKEGTLNLGFKQVLFEGRPAYEMKVFAGTAQGKALRNMNNKTIRIFEYDANRNIAGTVSSGKFKGFQAKVFVTGGKIATGQSVEEGVLTITVSILDVNEYFDNVYFMPITGNINDIVGLNDVELYQISGTTNVRKIGVRLQTSQPSSYINMYDSFSAELADDALWTAFARVTPGGAFTTDLGPTAVAVDVSDKGWAVTLETVAYAALPSGAKIKIALVAPETLNAADVVGIEGAYVIVTKP